MEFYHIKKYCSNPYTPRFYATLGAVMSSSDSRDRSDSTQSQESNENYGSSPQFTCSYSNGPTIGKICKVCHRDVGRYPKHCNWVDKKNYVFGTSLTNAKAGSYR